MKLAKYKKLNPKANGKEPKLKPDNPPVNVYVRLEKELVKSAKKFAKKNKLSLSALVENYFRVIHEEITNPVMQMPASRSLKGSLKGSLPRKTQYRRYLLDKYK